MSILKSPIQPKGLKEVCLGSTLGELRYYHSHPMWFFFSQMIMFCKKKAMPQAFGEYI